MVAKSFLDPRLQSVCRPLNMGGGGLRHAHSVATAVPVVRGRPRTPPHSSGLPNPAISASAGSKNHPASSSHRCADTRSAAASPSWELSSELPSQIMRGGQFLMWLKGWFDVSPDSGRLRERRSLRHRYPLV
jgi:hypothetical protein